MNTKMGKCKFSGKVVKCTYNTPNFRIFALDVDKNKYPNIKRTKYGNVSILGDIPELTEGVEYEVIAVEETSKYGISYRVSNIKRDIPTTEEDMYLPGHFASFSLHFPPTCFLLVTGLSAP